jgi:hypothetical protein
MCSVVYIGTTAEIAALTDMSEGCIAFDTTLKTYKLYHNLVWEINALDHSSLANLDDEEHTLDPHPQYLKLNKEGQTLLEDLAIADGVTIDGVDISEDEGKLDSLILNTSVMTSLTIVSATREIRRSTGSFIIDGFVANGIIYTTSTLSANQGPFVIQSITATSIVVRETTLSNEGPFNGLVFSTGNGFDDWNGSYSVTTIYGPEPKDCFISAYGLASGGTGRLFGYIGATASPAPSTIIGTSSNTSGLSLAFVMPVRKGQYWNITQTLCASISIKRMQIN